MLIKLKLLSLNLASAFLLVLFLCLGSQNLSEKYSINILIGKTALLPKGFLIGSSFIIGFVSGGITAISTVKGSTKN